MATLDTSKLSTTEPAKGTLVAHNIRIALKNAFPGVKFSVKQNRYSSITVKWDNYPMKEDVESLLAPFDICANDSMTDYAGTKSTEFSKLYGGIHYLWVEQKITDDVLAAIFSRMAENNPTYYSEWKRQQEPLTLENYKQGFFTGYHFYNLLKDYTVSYFENRLSDDEQQDRALYSEKFYKSLSESAFLTYTQALSGYEKLRAEVLFYGQFIESSTAKIAIAIETGRELDAYLVESVSHEISEAKKALHGEITDAEIEALDRHMANEMEKIKVAEILAIQPLEQTDYPENEMKKVTVLFPSLNKNNTLEENDAEIKSENNSRTCNIQRRVKVTNQDWDLITNNFLDDLPFLHGATGGCVVFNDSLFDGVGKFSERWSEIFEEHGINLCVELENESGDRVYIDGSGHTYARYVGRADNAIKPQAIKKADYMALAKDFMNNAIIDAAVDELHEGKLFFNPDDAYQAACNRAFDNMKGKTAPSHEQLDNALAEIYKKIFK